MDVVYRDEQLQSGAGPLLELQACRDVHKRIAMRGDESWNNMARENGLGSGCGL